MDKLVLIEVGIAGDSWAMGIDTSAVESNRETKSVSAETTMARDIEDERLLVRRSLENFQRVSLRGSRGLS